MIVSQNYEQPVVNIDRRPAPNTAFRRLNRKPSTSVRKVLADNLIRLREARGMTQLELAAASGLTNAYVSKLEQGAMNCCLANLEALTVGLDCSLVDLFGIHKKACIA